MNWIQCVQEKEARGIVSRFDWPEQGLEGFNCEAETTISDIWGAIAWTATYPGDLLLRNEAIARFFEIDPLTVGGGTSASIQTSL